MRIPRLLGLATGIGLLLSGCSKEPSVGGGGFEGETVSLTGKVTRSGDGIAGATVDFLDLRSNELVSRSTTDGGGAFRMEVPAGSEGFLEAVSGDSALGRWLVDALPNAPLEIVAEIPTIWRPRLVRSGSPVANATVRIVGSSRSVSSGSDGRIRLPRIRRMREWAVVDLPDGTRRELLLPPTTDSVIEIPDHALVAVDDFEGPGTRSGLGNAVGSGWWFATTDSASGGTSRIYPESILEDFRNAYSSQDARAGTSLYAQLAVDVSTPVHYSQIGLVLAGDSEWMDLSAVDSISFFAKGNGTVRLLFGTRTGMEPKLDSVGMTGKDLELPPTWTRLVVRRWEILPEPGSRSDLGAIPWSVESRDCKTMVFFFKGPADFQVDDVVFHGPRRADLIPHR